MVDYFPIDATAEAEPVGAFEKETKVKQSRSRETSSREMGARLSEEQLKYYADVFAMKNKGRTYMPVDATPPGWVGMWVRTGCRGRPDSSNVAERERDGWIAPSSSNFPKMSFKNAYGDTVDDRNILQRNGLMWMVRQEELHNLEQSVRRQKKDMADLYVQSARKMGTEGSFMTGRHKGQTVTFSEDPKAQYIASLFGR